MYLVLQVFGLSYKVSFICLFVISAIVPSACFSADVVLLASVIPVSVTDIIVTNKLNK